MQVSYNKLVKLVTIQLGKVEGILCAQPCFFVSVKGEDEWDKRKRTYKCSKRLFDKKISQNVDHYRQGFIFVKSCFFYLKHTL